MSEAQVPATDEAPSPWSVINDYSKTIITVASGFLAITVTFSGQIIGKNSNFVTIALLTITWLLLVVAVALAVAAAGFLVNYLKKGVNKEICIFCNNAAFYALVFAGVSFLIFGFITLLPSNQGWDMKASIENTLANMPTISGKTGTKWMIQSLNWDRSTNIYQMIVVEDNSLNRFSVFVDTSQKRITKFEKLP